MHIEDKGHLQFITPIQENKREKQGNCVDHVKIDCFVHRSDIDFYLSLRLLEPYNKKFKATDMSRNLINKEPVKVNNLQ